MAKETVNPTDLDEGWEDVKGSGIGEQWDFDRMGPFMGYMVDKKEVDLPEHSWTDQADGTVRKTAAAWIFAKQGTGEQYFIWDSYDLSEKLTEPGSSDLIKISYEGQQEIAGGKRRVKKYRVQIKRS